jgi:predicted outer membrane repeat protein
MISRTPYTHTQHKPNPQEEKNDTQVIVFFKNQSSQSGSGITFILTFFALVEISGVNV